MRRVGAGRDEVGRGGVEMERNGCDRTGWGKQVAGGEELGVVG